MGHNDYVHNCLSNFQSILFLHVLLCMMNFMNPNKNKLYKALHKLEYKLLRQATMIKFTQEVNLTSLN